LYLLCVMYCARSSRLDFSRSCGTLRNTRTSY
jgi:hypothetical protein